jgi:hypothetical protein
MEGDPLADVLTLASARCVRIGTLKAGVTWALKFPPPQKIKLTAVGQTLESKITAFGIDKHQYKSR